MVCEKREEKGGRGLISRDAPSLREKERIKKQSKREKRRMERDGCRIERKW